MTALALYASRTGTRRNLAAIREAGIKLLISRVGVWRTEGLSYCLDSGAYSDWQRGASFDEPAYEELVDRLGASADFVVLPDIVAGGLRSLDLSLRWSNRVRSCTERVLIAVQDGLEHDDLRPWVGPQVGIFLGGSTAWKLSRMRDWGEFCALHGCYYHVARVNTEGRFRLAHWAGADSVDGSSATRFAETVPALVRWRNQPDLLAPRRAA